MLTCHYLNFGHLNPVSISSPPYTPSKSRHFPRFSKILLFIDLCEKARIPRAFQEDEWPVGVWGSEPQAYEAFSKEEAPPCGRGSSLKQVRILTPVYNFVI